MQNLGASFEIADFDVPGDIIQGLVRQGLKRWEAFQMVTYFDQLDIHSRTSGFSCSR
jgi:hypothetical protein